ncbi:hypothetical protein CR513_47810 [Mucuna pruriens]|uniref:Uncharacterized protein n=1 Tax=Mucuna pruriens TaxID=157652 RepID=A0A371F3A9_MUCPR|nr:hypothetical protein CR513_47810 [Mucuna pruriens]
MWCTSLVSTTRISSILQIEMWFNTLVAQISWSCR